MSKEMTTQKVSKKNVERIKLLGNMNDTFDSVVGKALDELEKIKKENKNGN